MMPERKLAILLVEDERIIAMDIQLSLNELGYEAYAIASSADEAIALASARCPDLVLLDIRIAGGLDGIETAKLLKTRFQVPVVFLTAHADAAIIERAKSAEPYAYLLKPVNRAELHSAIEIAMHKHKIDRRLRERERWHATTLHSIADAVIAVDVKGRITLVNAAAESIIGVGAAEAVGKYAHEILRFSNQWPTVSDLTPLDAALRLRQTIKVEDVVLVNCLDGVQHRISDSSSPVIDGDELLGAVMVFRDVTEKLVLQKQLELADRLASLGTMAAGAAHELNNPLAVVVGNAGFVAEELQRSDACQRLPAVREALSDIQSAASRMSRIVSDLRNFSRPVESTDSAANLLRCVESAVRLTAHQFNHRATVSTRFGPTPRVNADEGRLEQVLVNLLVNAAHAIEPGNLEKNSVLLTTDTDEKGDAVIEVSDTGSGMPEDVAARIFEPFFTTKSPGVGTGLGLSICHGIVQSMGGVISVRTEPGKGTTFRIILPHATDQSVAAAAVPIQPADAPIAGRLLVIDDEDMLRRAMERILVDAGHKVTGTASARQALKDIRSGAMFDVILCDLMMPDMTGMEFFEELLSVDPLLARRVVFVSGGATSGQARAFLDSVANEKMDKPFKSSQLREVIQRLLKSPR